MPTARARYRVTETAAVARALERAEQRWPGEPRSKLLLRLLDLADHALREDDRSSTQAHHAAVASSSGAHRGAFSEDHLTALRQEWPA